MAPYLSELKGKNSLVTGEAGFIGSLSQPSGYHVVLPFTHTIIGELRTEALPD